MTQIKDTILKKIKSQHITMKPRWSFLLRGIFTLIFVGVIICFLLFVVALITLSLRETGMTHLPAFGIPGLFHFLINLPWLIILGVLLAFFIVELLVRKFSFGYRTPILITLSIIGIITIGGGILLSSMNPKTIMRGAGAHNFIQSYMYGMHTKGRGPLAYGTIQSIEDSSILLETQDELVRVLFDESTHFPDGKDILSVGSSIFVGGIRNGDTIRAFGISQNHPELRIRRRTIQ